MSSAGRVFFLGALLVAVSNPAAAVVYEVNAAAACPGSGSALAPFCTIASAAAVAAPGDVVNVAAGIYREQVVPPASGAAGLPITYRGAAGARLYGTNNLSGAGLWTLASGTTWSTPYSPPTNPAQVFVDGVGLAASSAGTGAVPVGGFFYEDLGAVGVLYVNLGGDNPGSHDVEAGARSFGFAVEGRSHLVIEGFEVRGHNTNGIRVRSSDNVVVRSNRVLRANSFGLVVDGTATTTVSGVEVSGNEVAESGSAGIRIRVNASQITVRGNASHHNRSHGLLATETTASVFESNRFYENATPGGGFTTGLRLDNSTGNVIQRNLAWGNQDTGFQVTAGSSNNLLVRNISYANQDHGFDIRECDAPRLVSNTAWANVNDGYSIEGGVSNAYLRNNIGSDNGLLTNGNDLWVDAGSTVGFSSNYDVFYRSIAGGNTIEYNGGLYASVAAFNAATGHEANGSGANPNLVNPAAGDFHPGLGPAIDSADAGASGFAALDFDRLPPIDLTGVADTGAGVPTYADRGALERRDAAPVARLAVTPKGKVAVGQLVTANGSTSSDDVGIVSYRFAWGDGTPDTVQAGPVATHRFARRGNFKVRLTVTDGAGQTNTVQNPVNVK
jgi:nitrous oxidase accessory protein NosD